jgi:ABC-type transport system involved in multi-copper enzyme maturation permease subunit
MATIRSALIDWRKYLVGVFTQVLGNPVIGRELRVRVRVGRGYLLQAFYLAFMILIVALAYQSAIGENPDLRNPVRVQEALVAFYRVVMAMLIALIVLIAPALTANAITLERERKTMDLLLATPLTARQLLVGKLVGSFAFIVLLLALTLPVSAVSVLLGGVSFPELLKAYLLIASGGLVLCAIGLFTSAYARSSTLAVLWSYLRVGGFLGATGILVILQIAFVAGGGVGRGGGINNMIFPVGLLNPFAAPFAADTQVDFGRWQLPTWIVGVVLCLLFTRLTLTAAARKVGLYDKDMLSSARRQLLVLLPLYVLLMVVPVLQVFMRFLPPAGGMGVWAHIPIGIHLAACAVPFLLLAIWVAPFGRDDEMRCPDDGMFRLSQIFRPSPSGALPFLTVAWLLMAGVYALAIRETGVWAAMDPFEQSYLIGATIYFTGLWVLFWGIGRFCSGVIRGRSLVGARALTLATITALLTMPLILELMFWGVGEPVVIKFWILYPFFEWGPSQSAELLFLWGSGMLVAGLLFGGLWSRRRVGTETPSHGV